MSASLAALVLAAAWQGVAPGLEVGRFEALPRSDAGDSIVTVVRVDPARHAFRLLSAGLLGLPRVPTAPEWVEEQRVVGVINASMFRDDHRTSLGYMRDGERVNNRTWTRDNAVFAAEPSDGRLPPVQIIDRTCQDANRLGPQYRVLVQNVRMIDCQRRNVWAQQPRRWSTACVGTDGDGRVLLVHCRSPYSTHTLIDVLLGLPIGLTRLMYVEGGPEASLYLKVDGKIVVSEVGSYETGFWENDTNHAFWPLPNVIAFSAR